MGLVLDVLLPYTAFRHFRKRPSGAEAELLGGDRPELLSGLRLLRQVQVWGSLLEQLWLP